MSPIKSCDRGTESGRGQPHSKTSRISDARLSLRQFLECGCPLPLFLLAVAFACSSCVKESDGAPRMQPKRTRVAPTFFVATNGNDAWSGKIATPNSKKSDGPFATPARALLAAREWRTNHGWSERLQILIRDGLYFLSEPLQLKAEDSDLILSNYGKERPILSGGRRLGPWKEAEVGGKKVWVAEVSEAKEGKWFFRELWVNG